LRRYVFFPTLFERVSVSELLVFVAFFVVLHIYYFGLDLRDLRKKAFAGFAFIVEYIAERVDTLFIDGLYIFFYIGEYLLKLGFGCSVHFVVYVYVIYTTNSFQFYASA